MTIKVPNIKGGYPLAGEFVGPAWRAMWDLLAKRPGSWVNVKDVDRVALAAAPIQAQTVRNLLWAADRAGLVERKYGRSKSNRITITHVRINSSSLPLL